MRSSIPLAGGDVATDPEDAAQRALPVKEGCFHRVEHTMTPIGTVHPFIISSTCFTGAYDTASIRTYDTASIRTYETASIRSSAVTAHLAVSASTKIVFTGWPASRCSRLQQRWARSIRYIVAHMHITGERNRICCSG